MATHHAARHRPALPLHRCGHLWRQDTSKAAEPQAKLSRPRLRWALECLVVQHLTVARVADGLRVSWNTANNSVLAEGQRALIEDPTRFDGVAVFGVDEHVWRHTRRGDKYVTVIIDLTPVHYHTGPSPAAGHGRRPFQSKHSSDGWPIAQPNGGTRSRSSRWTASPAARPPLLRDYPTPSR